MDDEDKLSCSTGCGVCLGWLRTKIFRKLLCVERGAHEDDFEVVSEVKQVLHDDEQNIRLKVPLVNLVQHQVTNTRQQPKNKTGKVYVRR